MTGGDVEDLREQLEDAEQALSEALDKLDEERVQAAFWRQAADHAVHGWELQEDVSITLREKLLEACNIGLTCPVTNHGRLHALINEVKLENGED